MGRAVARTRPKAVILEEAQRALEQRLAGKPDYEICRDLGISRATLHRRITLALEQRLNPTVDQYRDEQRERLSRYRYRLLAELDRIDRRNRDAGRMALTVEGDAILVEPIDASAVASLMSQLLRVEERLAKLDGLDAPTRVSVEGTVDAELAALADALKGNDAHPVDTPSRRV